MSKAHTTLTASDSSPDRRSRHRHALATVLGCVVAVFFVGFVDWATGVEARIFPLYYLPIAAGSLRVSRAYGLFLALLSTVLWALAYRLDRPSADTQILIFNAATQMVSFGVIAVLVANLGHRFEVERNLSRNDNLTSLPNSRAFYDLAGLLLAGARRSGRPFTVAFLDLDNFKMVNDEQGHLKGDLALKRTAEILRRATRASDIVARLGGDEFVAFLPDTGPEPARIVFERLGELLADAMKKEGYPVTASIGALSFLQAPESIEAAVHGADSLMYRAKQLGKNRVLVETIVPTQSRPESEVTG